jgi:4-amino-4-deoxy-L-arabinose transferase-like glycosyltransferase
MGIGRRHELIISEAKLVRWLLIALLLIGFALRIHRLDDRGVWWDEGWSIFVARGSPGDVLHQTATDRHPPLYFLVLHGWTRAAGDGEFASRLPSVFAGTLAIAATFALAKKVGGVKAAILAALIVAVSRFAIGWSQEIRQYVLASLLAALAIWAAILAWDKDRTRYYACYILAMTAGLYTLYLFAAVLVASNIGWFIGWRHSKQRRKTFTSWLVAQILILILVTPWLVYALPRYLSGAPSPPVAVLDLLKIYWTALVVGIPLEVEKYAAYTLPVLILFLAGAIYLAWLARRNWRIGRDLAASLTVLISPVIFIQLLASPWLGIATLSAAPRFILPFMPIYAVLLAWGAVTLVRSRRSWIILFGALFLVVSLVGLRGYHRERVFLDDYRSLTIALRAFAQPGDAVVLLTDKDWPVFAYNYRGQWRGVPHSWQIDEGTADRFLATIWEDHDAVWLVTTQYTAERDPGGLMKAWLELRAVSSSDYRFGDKALHLFARTNSRSRQEGLLATAANPTRLMAQDITPGLALVGLDQPAQDYRAGDLFRPFLYWQPNDLSGVNSIEVELGLLDDADREWANQTIRFPAGDYPETSLIGTPVTIPLPPNIPSGEYIFFIRALHGERIQSGELHVRGREGASLTEADVDISNPLTADFANGIRLLGYNLASSGVEPGTAVELTLFWQTSQPIERRYKVFTHLLGEVYNAETENFLWGQQDNEPVSNLRPTTTWLENEVISDKYAISLDSHAPAGAYRIEIGLYEPNTGLRLQVLDENGAPSTDHLIIGTVFVGE